MGKGRASSLKQSDRELICERIAGGSSVTGACEGICEHKAFWRALAADPALRELYARAREARADVRAERLDDILADVAAGKLDAAAARVMIDALKWQCAHERPTRYGDRVALAGDAAAPLEIVVTRVGS